MSSVVEQVGRVIGGRYRLLAVVGAGASAQVFAADDTRLSRRVAVKLLHPALAGDVTFLRKFQAEARLAASLNHRNVLHVYDWGDEDGVPYLVLEYLGGGSLRSLLDSGYLLTPEQAAAVGAEAANGLAYAHRRGLVHRDVKPANLLFDDDGRLLVADFGLARALAEAAITEPLGTVMGTARYASPEQVEGRPVDDRTDVYSLALTLYESVTGRVPFLGDTTVSTLMARVGAVLPPARELGPLAPILAQAAISEPLARLDAGALAYELELLALELDSPGPLPLARAYVALPRFSRGLEQDPTERFSVAAAPNEPPAETPEVAVHAEAAPYELVQTETDQAETDQAETDEAETDEAELVQAEIDQLQTGSIEPSPALLDDYEVEPIEGLSSPPERDKADSGPAVAGFELPELSELTALTEEALRAAAEAAAQVPLPPTPPPPALASFVVEELASEFELSEAVPETLAAQLEATAVFPEETAVLPEAEPAPSAELADAAVQPPLEAPLASQSAPQRAPELPPGVRRVAPPATTVLVADQVPKRRKHRWLPWLVVVLLVEVVAGAGLFVRSRVVHHDSVPVVSGLSDPAARAAIQRSGLYPELIAERYSQTVPAGEVISQSPRASAREKSGSIVRIVISEGPHPTAVPSLGGLSGAKAKALLLGAHLVPKLSSQFSETVTTGNVIAWHSVSTTGRVFYGDVVAVVISKGPMPQMIPVDLGGGLRTWAQAEAALSDLHLQAVQNPRYSTTIPAGFVVSTQPSPGATVPGHSKVLVFVSQGPPYVTIPPVYGKTAAVAEQALGALGLKWVPFGPAGANNVLTTLPREGQSVRYGTTVDIYLY
jgi:serine/threonine-protein kinase